MNSKQKGSRGERACRDVWKKHGYEDAHRSQQYSGKGESSADIEGISPNLHIEVKSGYSFKTIYSWLEQSANDAREGELPIVNCKMDRKEWLCVLRLDDFIELFKKAHPPQINVLAGKQFVDLEFVEPSKWWEQRAEECDGCRYFDALGRCLNFTNGCKHGDKNTSRRGENNG